MLHSLFEGKRTFVQKNMNKTRQYLILAFIGSLTLGLAPFTPEPHIWKQIMNLTLGRKMLGIDWFDLFMHGAPWIAFFVLLMVEVKRMFK
jgi:hypothetical protein